MTLEERIKKLEDKVLDSTFRDPHSGSYFGAMDISRKGMLTGILLHINNNIVPTKILEINFNSHYELAVHVETYWHLRHYNNPKWAKFSVELYRRTQARIADFR